MGASIAVRSVDFTEEYVVILFADGTVSSYPVDSLYSASAREGGALSQASGVRPLPFDGLGMEEPGAAAAQAVGKKVLIVDDEPIIADTLATIFKLSGYRAKSTYSAEQARVITGAGWVPDLLVIDVCLPEVDGINLAVLLKKEHASSEVLLMTGQDAARELLKTAKRFGYSFTVLAKPVQPRTMLDIAKRLLEPPAPVAGEQSASA